MTGEQTLAQLRAGIDECDSQLVQLLAKRNALTSQIGAIKQEVGAPLHAPNRESLLIEARRQQAEEHNVNPDLVEDMLRRMMRCLLYTSPSPRDRQKSRMPSSA